MNIYIRPRLAHIGWYPRSVRIRAMLDVRSSVSVRTSLRVHTGVLVSPICYTVSTFEGISENYQPKSGTSTSMYIPGVHVCYLHLYQYARGGGVTCYLP